MRIFVLLFVSFFSLAWACSSDSSFSADETNRTPSTKLENQNTTQELESNRKLIKNGNIEFEVKSVKQAEVDIAQLVKNNNGYISNENQNNYGERLTYSMEVRLPANQFDSFFDDLKKIALRIERQNVNVKDVTQEFIDVEARIKTKKELELRYIGLLEKAKTVDEILQIERELGTLRSDIESFEGRLKYLQDQTQLSTINIQFYEVSSKSFGFFSKLKQALNTGWTNFLSLIITLVGSWPYLLVLGLIIFLLLKLKKKN